MQDPLCRFAQMNAHHPDGCGCSGCSDCAVIATARVADAVDALDALRTSDGAAARECPQRIVARAEGAPAAGVSFPDAARVLSVPEKTVRGWAARGVLGGVEGSASTCVTPSSLAQVLRALNHLRQAAGVGRPPAAPEQVDDDRLRRELAGPLAQLRAGEAVPAPGGDISALFGLWAAGTPGTASRRFTSTPGCGGPHCVGWRVRRLSTHVR